jgi:hypothetical protein
MIDAFATQPQYVDHIAPVWLALPDDLRGRFHAVAGAGHRASQLGIRSAPLIRRNGEAPLTLVASYQDERHVRPRPVVLIEHGSGQSYGHSPGANANPSYPGGRGREGVCLFVCPNDSVAERWLDMYPDTPVAVVGCPFLDPWHAGQRRGQPWPGDVPLVVFSHHWDCRVTPECRNALPHYAAEWRRLAAMDDEERGFRMAGHAHPRAHEVMAFWRGIKVRTIRYFEDVLDQADCYVCDNSSTMFEFASTDRPVVVLNAPWYRRDVEHGLRFWRGAAIGPNVNEPRDVQRFVMEALRDRLPFNEMRREIVSEVYAYMDGHASERAAAAIVAVYEEGHWRAWRERRDDANPFASSGRVTLDGVRLQIVRKLRELGRPLDPEAAAAMGDLSDETLRRMLADLS